MLKCEVIKDLLPLYIDKVCSRESATLIEEHLAGCSSCRLEWENLQSAIPLPLQTVDNNRRDGLVLKAISSYWGRTKLKAFMKGAMLSSLTIGLLVLAYFGLTQWHIMKVPADLVVIEDVGKMKDGRIAFHLRLTDDYDLNQISYDMDEEGNFYMTPYRPIIKKKRVAPVGLFNMYQALDSFLNEVYKSRFGADTHIKALYIVTRDEHILVWQEGMSLPPASLAAEEELKR
ncbi:zf-HC2 domain-containing protein [Paenibacillus sinopodophylli]|uniref:zf-HC2 domain-containing protein n=1 Tax=Paenibacillus sinopodophylli TaxID=1837342 RepID=UPI00110CECBB|nr:zf-HC2 domain-containing protein [Paenibacillus sinopodophylli]